MILHISFITHRLFFITPQMLCINDTPTQANNIAQNMCINDDFTNRYLTDIFLNVHIFDAITKICINDTITKMFIIHTFTNMCIMNLIAIVCIIDAITNMGHHLCFQAKISLNDASKINWRLKYKFQKFIHK